MCHYGNTGVEQTPNKRQHAKLTLEEKILPPLLSGPVLAIFRSRVRRSADKLSRIVSLRDIPVNSVDINEESGFRLAARKSPNPIPVPC